MNQIIGYPPNFKRIEKKLKPTSDTVFTYGNDIYNPGGGFIADHLLVHEQIHAQQQAGKPETWWNKYLIDPKFRTEQELEAYRAQYLFAKSALKDRNKLAIFLHTIALDLSSPIYGNILSYIDAVKEIRNDR